MSPPAFDATVANRSRWAGGRVADLVARRPTRPSREGLAAHHRARRRAGTLRPGGVPARHSIGLGLGRCQPGAAEPGAPGPRWAAPSGRHRSLPSGRPAPRGEPVLAAARARILLAG